MGKIWDLFWTVFMMVAFCVLALAGIFVANNGIHAPVPRELHAPVRDNAMSEDFPGAIAAYADFSGRAEPVSGSSGTMYIPDNTAVSDIRYPNIRTRLVSFTVPESWIGNVVVRVIRYRQDRNGLYEHPLLDTEVVQFFEINTFRKYQQQEFYYTEDARRRGKITELSVASVENDLSGKLSDPHEVYFAGVKDGDSEYKAFLYTFRDDDGVADPEFAEQYAKLRSVDYRGCVISSMRSSSGTSWLSGSLMQSLYADGFDADGPGIKGGIDSVKVSVREAALPEHETGLPPGVFPDADEEPYEWQPFACPWNYQDHGAYFPFGPVESGGAPVSAGGGSQVMVLDMDVGGDISYDYNAPDPQMYGTVPGGMQEDGGGMYGDAEDGGSTDQSNVIEF